MQYGSVEGKSTAAARESGELAQRGYSDELTKKWCEDNWGDPLRILYIILSIVDIKILNIIIKNALFIISTVLSWLKYFRYLSSCLLSTFCFGHASCWAPPHYKVSGKNIRREYGNRKKCPFCSPSTVVFMFNTQPHIPRNRRAQPPSEIR